MLKHGILGLLNYADATGYEIMLAFRRSLSHFWVAQTSQIYRELQGLEEKGWATVTHIEQESRPDKNVFSITETGRKELHRWLEEDGLAKTVRSPMLMKTFFRGECSLDDNIGFFKGIAGQVNVFPNGEETASGAIRQYTPAVDDPQKALYWKFTVEFGVMYEKMLKEWSENCIRQLEELKSERHRVSQRQRRKEK